MTVSQTTGTDRRPRERTDDGTVCSRYDLVLLAIPAFFSVALVGHGWFGVSLTPSLAFASTLSAAVLGDALLRNPPSGFDASSRREG